MGWIFETFFMILATIQFSSNEREYNKKSFKDVINYREYSDKTQNMDFKAGLQKV